MTDEERQAEKERLQQFYDCNKDMFVTLEYYEIDTAVTLKDLVRMTRVVNTSEDTQPSTNGKTLT